MGLRRCAVAFSIRQVERVVVTVRLRMRMVIVPVSLNISMRYGGVSVNDLGNNLLLLIYYFQDRGRGRHRPCHGRSVPLTGSVVMPIMHIPTIREKIFDPDPDGDPDPEDHC